MLYSTEKGGESFTGPSTHPRRNVFLQYLMLLYCRLSANHNQLIILTTNSIKKLETNKRWVHHLLESGRDMPLGNSFGQESECNNNLQQVSIRRKNTFSQRHQYHQHRRKAFHRKQMNHEQSSTNGSTAMASDTSLVQPADIGFLLNYSRYLTAEKAEQEYQLEDVSTENSRRIEKASQMLQIFKDPSPTCDFHLYTRHMVFMYIDGVMESYGMEFLARVTKILTGHRRKSKNMDFTTLSSIIDVEANVEKKIVVYVEDQLPTSENSSLARMLIMCLLACKVNPIVIPCNDLNNDQLETVKAFISISSDISNSPNDISSDHRTVLKLGFLSCLESCESSVIILDMDRNLPDYNDLVAEAENRGHEVCFLPYHVGISRISFVDKTFRRILANYYPEGGVASNWTFKRANPNITTIAKPRDVIIEVHPQDPSNIRFPAARPSLVRSFYNYVRVHIGRLSPWSCTQPDLPRQIKPGTILPFSWKEHSLQLQGEVLSPNMLRTRNSTRSVQSPSQEDVRKRTGAQPKMIIYPGTSHSLTSGDQLENVISASKPYSCKHEWMKKKLFSSTNPELDVDENGTQASTSAPSLNIKYSDSVILHVENECSKTNFIKSASTAAYSKSKDSGDCIEAFQSERPNYSR